MNRRGSLWRGYRPASAAALLLLACALAWACQTNPAASGQTVARTTDKPSTADKQATTDKPAQVSAHKQVRIDLSRAVKVALPAVRQDLKPVAFRTTDGKQGWVLRTPGGRPIATPAYADGMLFVGGGYGSHEFYAFNAQTGALVWKMNTKDDGPTAAVVEDGLVAFNTESCTLVVADQQTGKVVWQQWLGDPLMSQPAISKGRVYIAYPAGQRGAQQQQNYTSKPQQAAQPNQAQDSGESQASSGSHRLLCADLRTGRHIWEQEISGDVMSAPIVDGEQIYFTCFDGTSYSLDARDGRINWRKENAGTSAPVIAAGQVLMTQKELHSNKSYEGLKRLDARRGLERDKQLIARQEAGYLGENKGGGVAISNAQQAALDSSVGFGNAPAAANLEAANKHLGVKTVAGGWAFQGSRAAYSRGQMLNAQGKYLNSVSAANGEFAWRAEVNGGGIDESAQVFSPPALGEQFMYLSTALGHLLSVRQQDGEPGFLYALDVPMTFQPALAEGNLYVGTSNGLLVCLKTGSRDADGWYAWGGNAQHNKNR